MTSFDEKLAELERELIDAEGSGNLHPAEHGFDYIRILLRRYRKQKEALEKIANTKMSHDINLENYGLSVDIEECEAVEIAQEALQEPASPVGKDEVG